MSYTSKISNEKLNINHDFWVVSILRKPQGSNPEHAFLMVEGLNQFGRAVVRRYDLFQDGDSVGRAIIIIKPENLDEQTIPISEVSEQIGDLLKNDAIYAMSWKIPRKIALKLHQNIVEDKANPPDYQVSGDKSLIAKSSRAEGHSCFTWAREKLLELNSEPSCSIEFPQKLTDFIAAKTSLYIGGTEAAHVSACCTIL